MAKKIKKLKKHASTIICVLLGNAVLAFMVAAFIMPFSDQIIMGGTTGISIFITRLLPEGFPLDAATIILILNVSLLIFGLFVLGKKFFVTTVASSILYPVMLAGFQRIPGIDSFTDNVLLATLFAGGLLGIALGLVLRVGSSTGGTDVINLVLHKWFHLPLSLFVYLVDITILGSQVFFSKPEALLLGIVLLVVETLVLDRVMIIGKSQIQIYVISPRHEEIRQLLLNQLEAGVTMTMIETGRLGNQQQAVLCVIPPRKLYAATELVHSVDPDAFITVTQIKEVRGQGFTKARRFLAIQDETQNPPEGN